jgi:hypothetical protein
MFAILSPAVQLVNRRLTVNGLYFAAVGPDPRGPEGRILIKLGRVKAQVAAERWLLEFSAKGYRFSNVISADQMGSFAFFEDTAARDTFISELITTAEKAPMETTEAASLPVPEAAPDVAS